MVYSSQKQAVRMGMRTGRSLDGEKAALRSRGREMFGSSGLPFRRMTIWVRTVRAAASRRQGK